MDQHIHAPQYFRAQNANLCPVLKGLKHIQKEFSDNEFKSNN